MSAILAKILNSTVGTSSLKALDTLLKADNTTIANNAADRLFNSLKNSAKLVGSDDVLFAYNGATTNLNSSDSAWYGDRYRGFETSSYITFDKSGSVIFKTIQTGTDSDGEHSYRYRVYDSAGNIVGSGESNIPYNATVEISIAANVVAGNKYKVAIVCHNDGSSPNYNLTVCGKTILFGPAITLTT